MSILTPGLLSVATKGTPITDVLVTAALDVLVVVALVASVAVISSLLEKLFRYIVVGFSGSPTSAFLIEGYLTYPGVLYHELSHALFGVISGARIGGISLRRREEADGSVTLGSVDLYVSTHPIMGSFQLTLSGIAPAIMGMLALVLMVVFAFPNCSEWWTWVPWIYAFICVLVHSELSRPDLAAAGRGLPAIALVLFAIFMVFPVDLGALGQFVLDAMRGGVA